MRLFVFNCLLLASLAAALPNVRHKRDFSTIRKWIRSNLFEPRHINIQPHTSVLSEKEYKLFRLPGYDDILIKVTPKKGGSERVVHSESTPINLNAFTAVVGTKDRDHTVKTLKEVNNMVSSRILVGKENEMIKERLIPMFPTIPQYVRYEDAIAESVPVVESNEPILTEVITPEKKVKLEVPIVPKYSYIQLQNNEPVMTYTAHYNHNPEVKLTETLEIKPELPACVKQRVDEVIQLGANPVRAIFPEPPTEIIDVPNSGIDINPFEHNNFFPVVETDNVFAEIGVLPKLSNNRPFYFNKPPRHPSVKTRPINRRPLQLQAHKPTFTYINAPVGKVNLSDDDDNDEPQIDARIGINRTLGPIPPQYIPHTTSTAVPDVAIVPKSDHANTLRIVDSKDNVANGMIPTQVYKQQSNPSRATLLKEDGLKTNTQTKSSSNKIPNYFYYVPPAISHESSNKQVSAKKNGIYTNKLVVTSTPKVEVSSSTTAAPEDSPLKENVHISFKDNPIVVPDNNRYVYRQKNADGSSMSVKANKNGVSVDITESNSKGRGDVPDEYE